MHDQNGTSLKVGDIVNVPCKITSLVEGNPDYCNVDVETIHGRRPDGDKNRFSAINTAQLVLVTRAPEEHEMTEALAIAAAAPIESGLTDALAKAKAAGAKGLDLLKILLANKDDIVKVVAEIKALIAKLRPTPTA